MVALKIVQLNTSIKQGYEQTLPKEVDQLKQNSCHPLFKNSSSLLLPFVYLLGPTGQAEAWVGTDPSIEQSRGVERCGTQRIPSAPCLHAGTCTTSHTNLCYREAWRSAGPGTETWGGRNSPGSTPTCTSWPVPMLINASAWSMGQCRNHCRSRHGGTRSWVPAWRHRSPAITRVLSPHIRTWVGFPPLMELCLWKSWGRSL